MKLFLISQNQNNSYDTFDSAVVAAPDEDTAKSIHPRDYPSILVEDWDRDWCHPKYVRVQYIGEAATDVKQGVICASFNAG